MMRRAAAAAALGLCIAIAAPLGAQQFDNFGDDPFEGFQLPNPDGLVIEGLGEEDNQTGEIIIQPLGENGVMLEDGIEGGAVLQTFPGVTGPVTSVSQPETQNASRVTLRALDRMRGSPTDLDLAMGETVLFGRIAIRVLDCRYPVDNPSSDAFAYVQVVDSTGSELFDGWMIASSPALNALEHARYDVWVLNCSTS